MATDPSFAVSPSAEKFLRSLRRLPGMEMGLMLAYGFERKDSNGQITDQYDGVHFYVAWDEPRVWSGEQVTIAGLDLWINKDIAEALRGKTLTFLHRNNGTKQTDIEDLLVAV